MFIALLTALVACASASEPAEDSGTSVDGGRRPEEAADAQSGSDASTTTSADAGTVTSGPLGLTELCDRVCDVAKCPDDAYCRRNCNERGSRYPACETLYIEWHECLIANKTLGCPQGRPGEFRTSSCSSAAYLSCYDRARDGGT